MEKSHNKPINADGVGRHRKKVNMPSDFQNTCGSCGAEINEDPHAPAADRQPCPSCGSRARAFKGTFSATVIGLAGMRFKAKRSGHKKPIYEGRSEPSVQRSTGIMMHLERFFDRINDWYRERITNPKTGEVVHCCDEPLSQHQGHGSAKMKQGQ